MFLKKIELYGFKSFSNRKEIFLNGGITGIVGPNGSGKSNIADALRWVLGEQSSKALRGSSMRDVIFNGTQTKSKKGFCEVSLTFDNTENLLNSEYTEICIKRKMYRSGESEYSINNNSCRLKDILNFFRDTGIGKEGYSIIGQGKIDEILDNKPVHRRRVFEEAAGISKFRVRKEEAESNLQKTHSNLVRVEDILSELELQLEPLEAQMRDAKHFIKISEKLKILEANICLYQYENAQKKIADNTSQIELYEHEIAETENDLTECGKVSEKASKEIEDLQRSLDEKNRELSNSLRELEKLKGALAVVDERIIFAQKTKQDNYDKLVSLTENIKSQLKQRKQTEIEIEQIEKEREELENQLSIITLKDADYLLESDLIKEIEINENNLKITEKNINSLELSINEKRVECDFLKAKKDELDRNLIERQIQLDKEENNAEQEELNIERIGSKIESLQSELNEINNNIEMSQQAKAETEEKADAARNESNKLNSRIEVIKDLTDKHEGYFDSVKKLLNAAKFDTEIKNRIIGTVAEMIETPRKYETAVEIALGNALQNIIVQNNSDAKHIIEYLRKNNIGRITFLPINNLKTRTLSQKEKSLLSSGGIFGVAADLVKCDAKARNAVDFLLGRTVIAENIESALKFAEKADYALKTVTLDGDIVQTGGPVTGGILKKKSAGLLSRNRVIEELVKQGEEIQKVYNLYSEEIKCRKQDEDILLAQKEEIEARLNRLNIKKAETRQNFLAYDANIKRIQSEICALEAESKETDKNFIKTEREIKTQKIEFDKRFYNSEKTKDILKDLYKRLDAAQNKSQENKREAELINEKLSEVIHQKELKKLEKDHFNISVSSMENTVREYNRQLKIMSNEISEHESKKHELITLIDKTELNTQSADTKAREMSEERNIKQRESDEAQKRSAELNTLINSVTEKKYKLTVAVEKLKASSENALTKLWDSYSLTYANALKLKKGNFILSDAQKECDLIKSEISKIGLVNPNAIEDYKRVKERYDNLSAQKNDLIKAAGDLQIVIDELLENMAQCFKDKFTQIDKSFRQVFSELFGGGSAALKLQSDENIMECGIDIAAEPPGKKLQNISLLSGGEKALTAIALLFAMLKINPSPVCLLDEIDAPLDDANLIRFSEYLKSLSTENQFIVITHRKPTMSACDTLYGVAMHEKGVSDLVSVRING